jgi:hypothetical protein
VRHSTLITPPNLHIASPLAIQNNKTTQNQTNNNVKELTYASWLKCATVTPRNLSLEIRKRNLRFPRDITTSEINSRSGIYFFSSKA